MDTNQQEIKANLSKGLVKVILQLCGGKITEEDERKKLLDLTTSSISFPNKSVDSPGGKPHDIEVRIALSLFHRWKRNSADGRVEIVSDLGLARNILSTRELAELFVYPLESFCRKEGLANDVRCQPSGLICIVTHRRSHILRMHGRLPCPFCTKWCQGEKGLWWHQQQNHNVEHSDATAFASSSTDYMAITPYDPSKSALADIPAFSKQDVSAEIDTDLEPLDRVKRGDLLGVQKAVELGYDPSKEIDRRGASPLMWAAGGGYTEMVAFLVEECSCEPSETQKGKRSFQGRTALHWAARNGHLEVVKYLVCKCGVDIEAATIDGTTAFGWASWQGHLDIMRFLSENGCNVDSRNSFGCNAVLWCAQGKGDVPCMEWLKAQGCNMTLINNNGHGVLHKAAQRGQKDVCSWFFEHWTQWDARQSTDLDPLGPDTEGYCPSDLAGMEGHEDLARELASAEIKIVEKTIVGKETTLPSWLMSSTDSRTFRISSKEIYIWEKHGGVRRMKSQLYNHENDTKMHIDVSAEHS